jgi:RasGEF domain
VVSKFIHIGVACHRLHNYATLTQIVMGLQSNHVSALKKTWEGLSSKDTKLWHDLQDLVDSRKNWSKMRNEMDKSSAGPRRKGEGCIPFVGIYPTVVRLILGIFMSDLVHITARSMPSGKIDFEGLRLRASIIKRTLRMIEIADEYDFQPEAGVGERCLWITAFDGPMLSRVAAGLE